MTNVVKVESETLERALESGNNAYVVVGDRRYLLVEVTRQDDDEFYDVTDPEDIEIVREVLADESPLLDNEEAAAYLAAKLKKHGIG